MAKKRDWVSPSSKIASGRAQMREAMASHGMSEAEGWSIEEETRASAGGTICCLRPVHPTLPTPEGYLVAIKLHD